MAAHVFISALLLVSFIGPLENIYGQKEADEPGALNAATPVLPVPSGTFGIGRIGYEWMDPSRPDTDSADPNAHRDVMVYLWYPAPRTDIGRTGPYLPGA